MHSSAAAHSLVYLLSVKSVSVKAAAVGSKARCREGKLVADSMIMSQRKTVAVFGGCTHHKICSAVIKWRFGTYVNKTAHCVSSVESSLRTSQYLNTLNICIVKIKGRFVPVRNAVYVHTYCRVVYAGAHTSYIN